MANLEFDLETITPGELKALVKAASDTELVETVQSVGTGAALQRTFHGMAENFRGQQNANLDATVQFVIDDDGTPHEHWIALSGGKATVGAGATDEPKATISTDLVSFFNLITGLSTGPALFMRGKVKLAGDMMFAARFDSFFDRP